MYRRMFLRTLAALGLPTVLPGCGSGSNNQNVESPPDIGNVEFVSDKPSYSVGDTALLIAKFTGSGRINPGNISVVSGIPVKLGPLLASTTYRLTVSQAGRDVLYRDLTVRVAYQNRFSPVSMGFKRASHVAVLDRTGRVLIVGGEGGTTALPAEVFAFEPKSASFSLSGLLLTGRVGHTVTLLNDGSILVFGGFRSLSGAPFVERFDPLTGVSRPTNTQPLDSRSYHTATLLPDGRVLIAGGSSPAGNSASDMVDIFDPESESFLRWPARLVSKRWGHQAVLATANTLVLYGGVTLSAQAAQPEVLDIQGQSSALLALPPYDAVPRLQTATAKAMDGDTFIFGGESFVDATPSATIAAIATGGLALRPGGTLRSPRTIAAAAPLCDGTILLVGGLASQGGVALSSTEIFKPGSQSTEGASMLRARTSHTATTLPNGKVLVVGGLGLSGGPIADAELYN